MLATRRRHRAVKFQDLPDAIVLHDNLLPQLVPELRVLTITEKPNSPPKPSAAERKKQRSRETRAKTPVFHRAKGGSEIPSLLQVLKNNRKNAKTPSKKRKKSTTSSSTKSQAPSHYSRHSKQLPDLPELSHNQCKLFAKWNERRQQETGHRPYTTQVEAIFDRDEVDDELERMRTSNTAELSMRLPGISTPTQSTKEQYIAKWLNSDFSKSPYTLPGDKNSSSTRKLRSRITSSQKIVTLTPFPNQDNG